MAARVNYPVPPCPKCGWKQIALRTPTTAKTVALFVTENATTVNSGGGLVQYPEHIINTAKYCIRIPRWGNKSMKRKQITIVPVDQ